MKTVKSVLTAVLAAAAAWNAFGFDGDALVAGARARFEAWKGDDETLVFPVVCDFHPEYAEAKGDVRDPRGHFRYVNAAAAAFGADFTAVLGDLGLASGAWGYGRSAADARTLVASWLALFAASPKPVVFAQGEDDYLYSDARRNRLALGVDDVAAKINARLDGVTWCDAAKRDSGWFDRRGCRVVFFNSSDARDGTVPYGVSTNLFAFLVKALETVPAGHAAVVLSHKNLEDEFRWLLSRPPAKPYPGDAETRRMLIDFRHGRSGEAMGVRYDFAPAAARGATLAFALAGDAHVDFDWYWEDVNWISVQSFAPGIALRAGAEAPRWGHRGSHLDWEPSETTLVDVVAVKPAKGQARIFRIGAGGVGRDRLFAFGGNRDPGFLPGEDAPPAVKPYVKDVPGWAREKIAALKMRFDAWKGKDEVFSFPVYSDNHSGRPELPEVPDWRDTKFHLFIAQETARRLDCDFLADLGDVGMDRNRHFAFEGFGTEFGVRRNLAMLATYAGFERPYLCVSGNHDVSARLPDRPYAIMSAYCRYHNAGCERRGMKLVTGPNRDYGHVDFAAKKTRVVFANTSEGNSYGATAAQREFVVRSLASTPDGWTAVFLSHMPLDARVGVNERTAERYLRSQEGNGIAGFHRAVAAIVNDPERKFRYAGAFAGDYHFSAFRRDRGEITCVSQSMGPGHGESRVDAALGMRYDRFDPIEETLVDVVAVKPASGEVRVFRLGAGGMAAEREWSFR